MKKYNGIDILYEDNHLLVVNKPAGLLSQRDKTNDDSILELLKEYIKKEYNKPGNVFLGSVHRLDRPTSGVMVFAKTSKALTRLTVAIKDRRFDKKYFAILDGKINRSAGEMTHFLVKDRKYNTVKAYSFDKAGSKKAILKYKRIAVIENFSLVEVRLISGRSHQIRSQFSTDFFPVAGDYKYGSKTRVGDRSICLHSYSLSFVHPVKKEKMEFKSLPGFDNFIRKKFKKIILEFFLNEN